MGETDERSRLAGAAMDGLAAQAGARLAPLGLVPLDELNVVDLTAELMVHEKERYPRRPLSAITRLVIHHSAASSYVGALAIARYHVLKNGWPGIGYHYVVGADGELLQVNKLETASYHCAGSNRRSVGLCLLGSFMKGMEPTGPQIVAARSLVAALLARLGLPYRAVVGHKELCSTACPGDTWDTWKAAILGGLDAL